MTHLSNVLVVNQLNNKAFEQQSEVSYVGVLMPVSCCCDQKDPSAPLLSVLLDSVPWTWFSTDAPRQVPHAHAKKEREIDSDGERESAHVFVSFLICEQRARPKHLL